MHETLLVFYINQEHKQHKTACFGFAMLTSPEPFLKQYLVIYMFLYYLKYQAIIITLISFGKQFQG